YMLADVLATRTHDPRAKDARFRWRILKPKLATITIFVVHSVRLLDGLAVYLDGVELGHDSWGTGIPVDMGTHHVRVDASGRRSWRGEVRIKADGEHRSATIPMLEVESNAITRMLWEPDFSPLRKGLIVAGTGLTIAGITSGIVFSVLMKEKQAEAMTATEAIRHRRSVNEMVCPVGRLDPACDELRGLVRERDTYNLGMALSFSFAGALIGTMGVMRLVSGKKAEPKDNRGAFAVVPSLSGISVMGKF
ncbi:MAG TPA: hypothetical protein PKA58_35890, partial [Polyangium sp.]|nr:hypothetical protein [Polyangium sp.]